MVGSADTGCAEVGGPLFTGMAVAGAPVDGKEVIIVDATDGVALGLVVGTVVGDFVGASVTTTKVELTFLSITPSNVSLKDFWISSDKLPSLTITSRAACVLSNNSSPHSTVHSFVTNVYILISDEGFEV